MCWLYGGKLRGRCDWGEWEGGLGVTMEKVLGSGGGAGACRNVRWRGWMTLEFRFWWDDVCLGVCVCLTTGDRLVTGLSMWATGSRMLKGTNPTWLKRLRHFHQRFDDSNTCETRKRKHEGTFLLASLHGHERTRNVSVYVMLPPVFPPAALTAHCCSWL